MITRLRERSRLVRQAFESSLRELGLADAQARDASSALETLWSYSIGVGGQIEEFAASPVHREGALQELFRALAVDVALLDRNLPWLADRAREIATTVSPDAFATRDVEVEEVSGAVAGFVAGDQAELATAIVDGRKLARSIAVALTYRDLLTAERTDIARLVRDMDSLKALFERIASGLATDAVASHEQLSRDD